MRVFDIVAEEITNEAPMGTLSKLGNTVAAKFGSGKASGRLETGQIANQLRKEFDVYLGKTGQAATPDAAIAFLKTKGYPTAKAQAVSSAPTPAATNTPTGKPVVPASATQAAQPSTTSTQQPASKPAIPAGMKQSTNPINKNPVKNPAAIKAPAAPAQQSAPAVNYDVPTWQRKGMQPPATTPAQQPAPAQTQQPAARSKFQPKPSQFGRKVVKNSVDAEGNVLSEDIIDNMFLAAAQEAQMTSQAGTSQQSTPAQQPAPTQSGSFSSAFKSGLSGQFAPAAQSATVQSAPAMSFDEILAAAKSLPPQQQRQLVRQLKS